MRRDLIAVIPALNCEPTIGGVVAGCRRFLETVVVVDDGSSDSTGSVARAAGAVVETLAQNRGKGGALLRGMEIALDQDPSALALLDGDGQHDPADLGILLAAWDTGAFDLLIGSRMGDTATIPRARFFTNYIGSRILSWMSGLDLPDSQSGYRIIGSDLARRLSLSARGYAIESEMILKAARLNARVGSVPVATIYAGAPSHFQPIRDTVRISCSSIYYKVFDEC